MSCRSQSLDSRNSCNPGNASRASKFSLLGQQFNQSSSHHSQPSSLGFSPGCHLQQQSHTQRGNSSPQDASASYFRSDLQVRPSHTRSQNRPATSSFENFQQSFSFGLGHDYNATYGNHDFQNNGMGGLGKPESSASPATSSHSLMNVLSVLQQNVRQLQAALHLMAAEDGQCPTVLAQQQAVAAGVASVVSQLVVATARILRQFFGATTQSMATDLQLINMFGGVTASGCNVFQQSIDTTLGNSPSSNFSADPGGIAHVTANVVQSADLGVSGVGDQHFGGHGMDRSAFPSNFESNLLTYLDMGAGANGNFEVVNSQGGDLTRNELMFNVSGGVQGPMEEHDSVEGMKDDEDDGEAENLPPGSYELVEMDAVEILAEHTHFCETCGKGFKRDANLRMHMRGHGDEYKTPAALARPDKFSQDPSMIRPRRYSCPFVGCKRNKKHRKFQPLKTLLCVKNHYRRSHCPKILTCSKCKTKKFSVLADLKTHEKHCGRDKWQCSCGTTFSRKDKLLGHIGLFTGHTAALPLHQMEGMGAGLNSDFNSGNNSSLAGNSGNESVFLAGLGSKKFGSGDDSTSASALVDARIGVGETSGRDGSLSLSDHHNGASLADGSPSDFAGSLDPPSSSMFHGLFPHNFLQQTSGTQTISDVLQ